MNLLVRKQTALKAPAKTLSKIKSLLQAYALAKPTIRYSLKVSKGSNDSFNWIYPASKSLPASVDAAVKVVGKVVVTQCEWKTWCASLGFIDQKSSANELDDFILEALLPARHCGRCLKNSLFWGSFCADVAAVSNIGQFVSIDNRPIAHRKNAMKKVISIFKSFLQSSSGTDAKVVNPFLFLNIFCPLGSYDINSEPGKDEVLFTDEERIVTICNSFFRQFYNNLEDDIADEQIKPSYGKASSSLFDEPATSASIASNPRAKTSPIDRARLETTSLEHRLPPKSTMYDGEDDHLDQHVSFGFRDDDPIYDMASPDLTALNPWTIAKLNAPIHSPESRREWQREAQYNGQLLTPQKDVYDAPAVHTPPSRLSFPSKERLVPRGSPPSAPHNGTPLCPASPKKIRQQPQTQGKNLDGWLKKGSPFTAMTPTRPTPISAPLPGTPLSEIPDAPQRLRRQIPRKTPAPTAHKPFVLPVSNKPLQTERTPLPETPPRRTLGFIKSSPRDDGSQLSASWLHDGVPEYRPSARYRDGPSEEEEDIIDSFDTAENARVRVPLLMLATTLHSTRRLAVTLARFDDYVCSGNVRMDGDLVGFSRDFAVMLE